jgi:hypothetical protein
MSLPKLPGKKSGVIRHFRLYQVEKTVRQQDFSLETMNIVLSRRPKAKWRIFESFRSHPKKSDIESRKGMTDMHCIEEILRYRQAADRIDGIWGCEKIWLFLVTQ